MISVYEGLNIADVLNNPVEKGRVIEIDIRKDPLKLD